MSSFGVALNVFGWQPAGHTVWVILSGPVIIRPVVLTIILPLRCVELECLGTLLSAGSRKQVNMRLLLENSGSLFSLYAEWLLSPVLVRLFLRLCDPKYQVHQNDEKYKNIKKG